jgi:hypothetical protein
VLHELLPTAKRIGLLVDPQQKTGLREVEAVGRDLGLELIAEQVLRYMARYTHRVAIANSRLVAIDHEVSFKWKDRRPRW